jgi:plastocyanin
MKKGNLVLAMVWVAAIAYFSGGCSNPERNAGQNIAKTDTIFIENMQFVPSQISIHKGDEVIWINKGIVGHNVTDVESQAWTSGNIEPGSSWKMKPTESIQYFCTIHPTRKGSVTLIE